MSEFEGERAKSKVVVGEDGDDEEEEEDNVKNERKIKEKAESGAGGCGCGNARGLKKAKKVVCFSFTNAKKHRTRTHSLCHMRLFNETGSRCFCFKQSSASSGAESHTSDCNDPSFSCEKLRSFIENNRFYSPVCNPHFHSSLTPSYK